jgi:hypothetical protein
MPEFFVSFGAKAVTVRASYTLLLRWTWKTLFYLVVGTGLLTFTSDAPLPCEYLYGQAARLCMVGR